MEKPEIRKENVELLWDSRFLHVYDLQYAPGRHYYDASRRKKEDLIALKSEEEQKSMLPDAVSCFVIIAEEGREPRLLLQNEYRYPAGRFLLSVPAGLIDPEDAGCEDALLATAKREIKEETGVEVAETDRLFTVNPFVYSTPGMTDECNALVCAVLHSFHPEQLSTEGAVGSECFDGFFLLTRADAKRILRQGCDDAGVFYSIYTWAALSYFLSGMWEE